MTVSSDLITYRNEVFHFLQTVTIKYSPIAELYKTSVAEKGYEEDESNPLSWKYYLNLVGEYHPTDTPMEVMSLDTQEIIPFTKASLAAHPRTAATYRPGSSEYEALCNRYPDQTDLIKNIVYPVRDAYEAYQAPDLALLRFGDGYLEVDEQPSIIQAIKDFLKFFYDRWYLDFLNVETYFYVTNWAMLWQLLPVAIFHTRIKNIFTSEAHTFHVWEYLTSNGIGDYRDILTRRQALFLYRNMRYLQANRGKQSNLILLTDRLLKEISVGMVGKTVYQHTVDSEASARWTPEFISEPVPTLFADVITGTPPQSVSDITYRLAELGLEHDTSFDGIYQTTTKIASTTLNTLPTKLLEIKPLPMDRKYADLLANFILDTTVHMVTSNRYQKDIVHTDEVTGLTLELTAKDALALYYLCVHKAFGDDPVYLPKAYAPMASYRYDINKESLPTSIMYDGHRYPMTFVADVDNFIANLTYPAYTIEDDDEFTTLVARLFSVIIRQTTMVRATSDHVSCLAYKEIFNQITYQDPYDISLSDHDTYAAWFQDPAHASVYELTRIYDSLADARDLYNTLADTIFSHLISTDHSALQPYTQLSTTSEFYGRLKQLFIQLCSYNVLFLDTSRDRQIWVFLHKLSLHLLNSKITSLADVTMGVGVKLKDTAQESVDSPMAPDHYGADHKGRDKKAITGYLPLSSKARGLTRIDLEDEMLYRTSEMRGFTAVNVPQETLAIPNPQE